MSSRFSQAYQTARPWLLVILPAALLMAVMAHFSAVRAQSSDQLTVYSPQTTYSVPLQEVNGQPYAGLVELLEPLGALDAKPDGKKYKVRFTPPGARQTESQFNEGKDKSKIRGENYKLPANFVLQNGRGYIPLAAVPEVLTKLVNLPVQLHPAARRLFLGDVPEKFTLQLEKGNPSHLLIGFPNPVNPSIATEPGRVRFTFRREPVVSNGQDKYSFDDPVITGATFTEHDGLAEIDVTGTAPLLANFADGGRTIIVNPVPPPPPAPTPAPTAAAPPAAAPAATAQPQKSTAPRFLVIIDPAHGGADNGATITSSLAEKDVVLALARRVQRELINRGIATAMLRNSDVTISLDQRAISTNAARPALYIVLHAANTGRGVHVFTSMLPPTTLSRQGFLPWDTAQASFLDLSGVAAGSVAAELESRKLPNTTLLAPLRPMNNIAAPAIAIEIASPDDNVEDIASPQYQEQVAQAIAAGVAAVRGKLPEVRP